MGILNITPDSFYDGGMYFGKDNALEHAFSMVNTGADLIDIGGQSTRPGAGQVSVEDEGKRVLPVIDILTGKINVPISIDTFYSEVADEALSRGVSIVNDITGLNGDPAMAGVIARHDAGVIIMHSKGTPRDMQNSPTYNDLMEEIIEYLRQAIDKAVSAGISAKKIIIDPGIGFGKTVEHNLMIINRLSELKCLGCPIAIGVSRKSFIGAVLDRGPQDRIFGTAGASVAAIISGANIIRVHDVREMSDVARIADAVIKERR